MPNRRQFLQSTAAIGTGLLPGYWISGQVSAAESRSPNEKIQVACIGVGGSKGPSDVKNASRFGKIVAMCDVDRDFLDGAAKIHRVDQTFSDFREMFDKVGDTIDAVTVTTPDHTHAVIAAAALKAGKHVYCQKPLTRTIYEARRLGEIAREAGVATQMGNQGTAHPAMRRNAMQIKAGRVGTVSEVHVWTNRPVWPQGERRPTKIAVPDRLDWNAWLGPAPYRSYGDGYHPFKWRGWWDYGTGALGDMACHTANMPFMALDMRDPTAVQAECAPHDGDSFPAWSRIDFDFPERNGRAPFKLTWYDGGQKPETALFDEFRKELTERAGEEGLPTPQSVPSESGCIIVGDQGKMYLPDDYGGGTPVVLGGVDVGEVEVRPSRGHEREWFDAIRNPKQPAVSNFPDYSGPLTETILLGNLALWSGGRVEWDAKNLVALNNPSLQRIVKPEYANGYELM